MKLFTAIIIASAALGAAVAVDPTKDRDLAVRRQEEAAPSFPKLLDGAVATDAVEADNKHPVTAGAASLLRGATNIGTVRSGAAPAAFLETTTGWEVEHVNSQECSNTCSDTNYRLMSDCSCVLNTEIAGECFINDQNKCSSDDMGCLCKFHCCNKQSDGNCCTQCHHGNKVNDRCYEDNNGNDNCGWAYVNGNQVGTGCCDGTVTLPVCSYCDTSCK